ncbi:oxygenase MpaB family protein [Streptomyces atroolivaceus]|uniref:oxygenase MpaB family protein n=1 Tax=Streptomyces atroolivaceus TaxID=66869 RepID=UPI003653B911
MDMGKGAAPPSAVRAPLRGGAAWRYFGDIRNFLVAPQLLLFQVAHPVVGAGVEDHSDFRAEPWQRLWRTVSSLHTVIYGGRAAATAEGERLLWSPREERAPRRFTRPVRVLVKLVPPPLRVVGALAIAYWNTHGPGTGPSTRRTLGAPA